MRTLVLAAVLCAVSALADEGQVELFADKGDLFIKAGSKAGLRVGSTVTVLGDKIGNTNERRRAGTATVTEVWETVSRVNLDESAKSEKAPKLVALNDANAGTAQNPKSKTVHPEPVEGSGRGSLKGHATINGLGPLKRITLTNDTSSDWHNCELRLPDNRRFKLSELKAQDRNSISLPNFSQDGVALDVPLDSMLVRCAEGETRVHFGM